MVSYSQYYKVKQENKTVKLVAEEGTIKFYFWYVCDTLLVVKPQDVSRIHKFMNTFDKDLQFIIDLFENKVRYFLDSEMPPDGISIYLNDTKTVFCINNASFAPLSHLPAWIS